MTPAQLIQDAESRSIQDTGGISYEYVTGYLANGWVAQGSVTSRGFVRADKFTEPSKPKREAHPQTLMEGE